MLRLGTTANSLHEHRRCSENRKLNKKAYMITPLLFIVFLLITAAFAFYTSRVDRTVSEGVQLSAAIEKGVNEVYKEQLAKETLVRVAAYECSSTLCCKNSTYNSAMNSCIGNKMNLTYGNATWSMNANCPNNVSFRPNLEKYNTTNINVTSNISSITVWIKTTSLNQTC